LTTIYFDLGKNRVPSRYDALLPIPSARIVAELEKGSGLVAARERDGAPPILLIAAPRSGQLGEVQTALSRMKQVPVDPVTIKVNPTLQRSEIRAVVQSKRKEHRACYEELLKRSPTAAGQITLRFTVKGDGTVSNVSVENSSTLRDPDFEHCVIGV